MLLLLPSYTCGRSSRAHRRAGLFTLFLMPDGRYSATARLPEATGQYAGNPLAGSIFWTADQSGFMICAPATEHNSSA